MVIAIVIAILLLTITLAGVGAYIVIHHSNRERETEGISKIAVSGKYAAVLRPVADSLADKKPSKAEIEVWLNLQGIDSEQKNSLMEKWQNSLNESIKTVSEGDVNGVTTYRIDLGPKDKKICDFLHKDHFFTRDQINKNAEILPPYCLGSDSKVVPKHAWDNKEETGGWKSVVPKDGNYGVPNWQQIV
jgi:flagellar basal body-associated protein FliL